MSPQVCLLGPEVKVEMKGQVFTPLRNPAESAFPSTTDVTVCFSLVLRGGLTSHDCDKSLSRGQVPSGRGLSLLPA